MIIAIENIQLQLFMNITSSTIYICTIHYNFARLSFSIFALKAFWLYPFSFVFLSTHIHSLKLSLIICYFSRVHLSTFHCEGNLVSEMIGDGMICCWNCYYGLLPLWGCWKRVHVWLIYFLVTCYIFFCFLYVYAYMLKQIFFIPPSTFLFLLIADKILSPQYLLRDWVEISNFIINHPKFKRC